MNVSISHASKLTGKSISTLNRYCNAGKLTHTQENNQRMLNIAELERVFGKLENADEAQQSDAVIHVDNQKLEIEIAYLKKENDTLKTQLRDATKRESDLLEIVKNNSQTLMLTPPPKQARSGNIVTYFKNLFTPTEQDTQPTQQGK